MCRRSFVNRMSFRLSFIVYNVHVESDIEETNKLNPCTSRYSQCPLRSERMVAHLFLQQILRQPTDTFPSKILLIPLPPRPSSKR